MKNTRLSASELNRFTYCPYQWYYNRIYGQKNLNEKRPKVKKQFPHENNFKRGIQFHEDYYKLYQRRKYIQYFIILILIVLLIGWFGI